MQQDVIILHYVIPGKPKSWQRTHGQGKMRFESKDQRSNKGVIQVHTLEALSKLGHAWPTDWIYRIRIDAYWRLPTGKHRKRDPRPMEPRGSRPDCDNLGKLIADAVEHGILWDEDRQVVDMRVRKWTAKQGEPPRTEITVWAMKPGSVVWKSIIDRD